MPIARTLASILHRTGIHARLQETWRRDIAHSAEAVSLEARREREHSVARLERLERAQDQAVHSRDSRLADHQAQLTNATTAIQELRTRVTELEHAVTVNNRQASLLADWLRRGNPDHVCAHVTQAVSEAELQTAPTAHLVVEGLFPPDFHALLRTSLREESLITHGGPQEMDLGPGPFDRVPALTRVVWEFVGGAVADALTRSAVPHFHAPMLSRYDTPFGRDRAETLLALPPEHSGERLVLGRRGDDEPPHLDPKRASLAVFVNPGGTDAPSPVNVTIYAIDGECFPIRTGMIDLQSLGLTCTSVSQVPLPANSALVLMNAGYAHALEFANEAAGPLAAVFQFYIGPPVQGLIDVASTLSPAEQQPWLGLVGEDRR